MPKSWTDEAIVLRTYNVGETDRFCLLLTAQRGRIAARATGVRRLLSCRASGLLPLHRVLVVCETHSFGETITSATCLDPHRHSWQDPEAFSSAQQGIELLLRLTEEGTPMPQVYPLTCAFLTLCFLPYQRIVLPLFMLKVLLMLGSCPSLTHSSMSHQPFSLGDRVVFSPRIGGLLLQSEDRGGQLLSPLFLHGLSLLSTSTLEQMLPHFAACIPELTQFVQCLTGSQLGGSLKAEGVCLAMSSARTPT